MIRRLALCLALAAGTLTAAPALADSIYTDGPIDNLTGFVRPYLGVGNLITVVVSENNTAETGAGTTRSKDGRVQAEFDFGALIPKIAKGAVDLRGRDDFKGTGVTSRNGKLQMDVATRIEEVLPNGTLRIFGKKSIRVNDEETEITIRGIVRPLDLTPDGRVDSSRVADMQVDFKGTGPASAKATPGLLTRLFNWLF